MSKTGLLAVALFAGVASAATMAAAEEARGYKYADFLLGANDSNGDGVLTKRELGKTGVDHFHEIDLNGDGLASRDELADWYVAYARPLQDPQPSE